MRILVIEDDGKVASFIGRGLRESGYVTETCHTAADGQAMALAFHFDAVLLDIMLADRNGLTVVQEIRRRGLDTPVLALSARTAVEDRVAALDAGCDGYLAKPFAFAELLARLTALMRRHGTYQTSAASYGGLAIDPVHRRVTRDGHPVGLTNREYALLSLFMREPERVFSKAEIMSRVWGASSESNSNVLEVYMKMLRRKIDQGFSPKLLHTVRGFGYALRKEEANSAQSEAA